MTLVRTLACDWTMSSAEDAKMLWDWVAANGGNVSRVSLRHAGVSGRGLFMNCDVAAGERIFSVPLTCLLGESVARASAAGTAVVAYATRCGFEVPGRVILAMYLMSARACDTSDAEIKATPDFAAFVKSLPRSYDTPCAVADRDGGAQLESLSGTAVCDIEKARRVEMRRTYNAFFPALSSSHPQLFPSGSCSFSDYAWAFFSVATRTFPSCLSAPGQRLDTNSEVIGVGAGDAGVMVPLADMINHAFEAHLVWETDEEHLHCIAAADLAKGEEVLFSYGSHSNGRLLITYGFCVPGNPFNVVRIRLGVRHALATAASAEELDAAKVQRDLREAGLLGASQPLDSLVVPSLTLSEKEVGKSPALRACSILADAAEGAAAGPGGPLGILRRAVAECLRPEVASLREAEAALACAGDQTTPSPLCATYAHVADTAHRNVLLYRAGCVESLEWTLRKAGGPATHVSNDVPASTTGPPQAALVSSHARRSSAPCPTSNE